MNREGSVAQARECSVSTDIHFLVVGSIMPVYICIYMYIYIGPPNWDHTIYTVLYFFSFIIDTL